MAQSAPDTLPAPEPANGAYYLAASINGLDKQLIVQLDRIDGAFYIGADELRELGVLTAGLSFDDNQRIALSAIPDLRYTYHADSQRIDFSLPADRLQAEMIGYRNPPPPTPCKARNRINCVSDCAIAQATDAPINSEIASISRRRRPKLSDSLPYSGVVTVDTIR